MQPADISNQASKGNNIEAMIKSPFKFPDNYTSEDREIFFGRKVYYHEFQEYALNSIPPFQGLLVCRYMRWTASDAEVLCAFSALSV